MADPFDLLFASTTDRDVDADLLAEFFWSTIARHTLLVVDQTVDKNIYGEPEAEPVYTESDPFPIAIILDPDQETLDKFGYDTKREAIGVFCVPILTELDLEPKVGDRINFTFTDADGDTTVEQFIVNESSPASFLRQHGYPYQMSVGLDRTQKKKVTPT